jgi:predicted peroxiredoxin
LETPQGSNKVFITATYGPANPERCPGAFLFAQEAANSGADVSLCFILQAPLLLKKGVAETLFAKEGGRTIREFIDDTFQAGVQFFVCDAALELCDMTADDLIEEIDHMVGPSFVIREGLEADLVLNF